MARFDVLGIGRPYADTLVPVPHLPTADEVLSVEGIEQQGGGPVPTALVTVGKLGRSAAIWGRVSADHYGEFLRQDFIHHGVDTTYLQSCPGYNPALAVILVDRATGTRAILHHQGNVPLPTAVDISADVVRECRILHLSGSYMLAEIEAARLAKAAGVLVSLDGGAGLWKTGMDRLVSQADVLVAARHFAEQAADCSSLAACAQALMSRGPRTVVITDGADGSHGWTFDGRYYYQPAFSVTVVDTTGAGDVYHGAFLFGLLNDWPLPRMMAFASATAALKCTRVGGRAGIPTLSELEQFLNRVSH
jgi:sulfofructose kinase